MKLENNLSSLGVWIYILWMRLRGFVLSKAITIFTYACYYIGLWLTNTEKNKKNRQVRFRGWFYHISSQRWLWGKASFVEKLEMTKEDRRVACNQWAARLCRKCYGRGYSGFNIKSQTWEVCDCVRERLQIAADSEKGKTKVNIIRPDEAEMRRFIKN